MQIIHRVSLTATAEDREELALIGFAVKEGLVTFEVDESHPTWNTIRDWIQKRRAVDVIRTTFTEAEVSRAAWLVLVADWHCGYPQPDEDYLSATYDLSAYCTVCGIGAKQRAAFRMNNEPNWRNNGILQLNWVFDEFFVKPIVWEMVFEPLGIPCRSVLNNEGAELKNVVQLTTTADEVDVVTDQLKAHRCESCGRLKYEPVVRGWFPSLRTMPGLDLAKTKQHFGSGKRSFKGVLISQRCAAKLAGTGVLGASLKPVFDALQQQRGI